MIHTRQTEFFFQNLLNKSGSVSIGDLLDSLNDSSDGNNKRGFLGLFVFVLLYVSGGITYFLPVLVILMLIDYFVGIAAAAITQKKFSVKIALIGILKKVTYLAFVIFAQLPDTVVICLYNAGILDAKGIRYATIEKLRTEDCGPYGNTAASCS